MYVDIEIKFWYDIGKKDQTHCLCYCWSRSKLEWELEWGVILYSKKEVEDKKDLSLPHLLTNIFVWSTSIWMIWFLEFLIADDAAFATGIMTKFIAVISVYQTCNTKHRIRKATYNSILAIEDIFFEIWPNQLQQTKTKQR